MGPRLVAAAAAATLMLGPQQCLTAATANNTKEAAAAHLKWFSFWYVDHIASGGHTTTGSHINFIMAGDFAEFIAGNFANSLEFGPERKRSVGWGAHLNPLALFRLYTHIHLLFIWRTLRVSSYPVEPPTSERTCFSQVWPQQRQHVPGRLRRLF
jgi:hypothetical protein